MNKAIKRGASMKTTIGTITAHGKDLQLMLNRYKGGAMVIQLVGFNEEFGYEEPWGDLTTNIPGLQLGEGEILVKTWGENEGFRAPALASGLFADTGRRVRTGYAVAEIWRIQGVPQ